MPTLYIRDVPEDVAETLKQRAADSGLSLSGYVNAELARISRAPTNATLMKRLREHDTSAGPSRTEIVEALRSERR